MADSGNSVTNHISPRAKSSPLHAALSLIVPGLGQVFAGAWSRGITIFASIFILGGLSVWTIAQEARFPDYGLSFAIFVKLVLETGALLIFLIALRQIFSRFIYKDPAAEGFSLYGVVILFFLALLFAGNAMLGMAGTPEQLALIYTGTAVFAAGALAALWLWQVSDAARIGTTKRGEKLPSMAAAIIVICLLIFSLGYNITGIDLPKAISEYQDLSILLPRIIWPWRAAFAYDQNVVEEIQRIQAPCPEGEVGPLSNEPHPTESWISATPTCGEIGVRDLTGSFTPGTELTITGGNFTPGVVVHILWKNPIGNPFVPRGVGPTDITIGEDGTFTTQLAIPDVVVPESTASGAQIHQLVVREESLETFGGRLSDDMNLALTAMLETIMIGLMATFLGIIFAFPVSFLAARNLMASIVSPLNRLVGSVAGLAVGVWAAAFLTGQITDLLGGLAQAPIAIFLIGITLLFVLGFLGMRIGGRLFGSLLTAIGEVPGHVVAAFLLAVMAALPGYYLGLGFSRGILSIVIDPDLAAQGEVAYGYAGALIVALAAFGFAWINRKRGDISIGLFIYSVTRTLLNIVRSIEPLIWAIVAGIWVGLGPFAGTIALTLHTIASLAKLYSEAIESIDPGPLEALHATGADRLQTIVYAVIPQILPPFISFTIYRWDINVRMSTIIGLVGGGGIGFILIQWIRLYQYDQVGLAVWLITITVATLDYVSSAIRERFV
jgi:phosphonate ABC transporter permease subunit PhnE